MSGSYRSSLSHMIQGTSMKRLALLFVSLALSILPIGCGEQAAPPAGTPGTGPYTGPSTKGVAQEESRTDVQESGPGRRKGNKKGSLSPIEIAAIRPEACARAPGAAWFSR